MTSYKKFDLSSLQERFARLDVCRRAAINSIVSNRLEIETKIASIDLELIPDRVNSFRESLTQRLIESRDREIVLKLDLPNQHEINRLTDVDEVTSVESLLGQMSIHDELSLVNKLSYIGLIRFVLTEIQLLDAASLPPDFQLIDVSLISVNVSFPRLLEFSKISK